MEDAIPSIAYWLGSHALAFFAIATVLALAALLILWHAIVRHAASWLRWVARAYSALERRLPGTASERLKHAWSRAAAYFTAYAVAAFAFALAGIALFVELADEIEAGADIAVFDQAFTTGLRDSTQHATLVLFSFATHLGDPWFLTALATLVALVLLWRGQTLLMLAWIAATAGNGLLTRALKVIFERTRPLHEHGLLSSEGWSFPSGHASGSAAVFTMLMYVILRGRDVRWWHVPLLGAAMALILVVGFSRVILQVHYLSDVVAGYIVAGSWLAICIAGAEVARVWRRPAMPSRDPIG
jgi:undecaprenyl-diphosphatase